MWLVNGEWIVCVVYFRRRSLSSSFVNRFALLCRVKCASQVVCTNVVWVTFAVQRSLRRLQSMGYPSGCDGQSIV